jgi:hypothetical protein
MDNVDVIFRKKADPFLKRVWQIYLTKFLLFNIWWTILFSTFIIPAFYVNGGLWIAVFLSIALLSILFYNIRQCYKWALFKITEVTFFDGVFTIVVICKDIEHTFKISQQVINTRLHWRQPNRQNILILHIDDGINKIAIFMLVEKKMNLILKIFPTRYTNERTW